jgi:hypothetical protein
MHGPIFVRSDYRSIANAYFYRVNATAEQWDAWYEYTREYLDDMLEDIGPDGWIDYCVLVHSAEVELEREMLARLDKIAPGDLTARVLCDEWVEKLDAVHAAYPEELPVPSDDTDDAMRASRRYEICE